MAHDASKVQQIVDGFIYLAPVGTPKPTSADAVLDAGFKDIGYYSDEGYELAPEAGDSTEIEGHNGDIVLESTKPGFWTLKFSGLEARKEVVEAYFNTSIDANGHYVVPSAVINKEFALVVKGIDQNGDLALDYFPRVKVSDRESVQGVLEDAKKYGLTFRTFRDNGINGHIESWNEKLEATPAAGPVISSITPSGQGEGEIIKIVGSGFTGATGVSIGGDPALDFTVLNSSLIVAVLDADSAGAVNVTVTTPIGTSDAASYTRAA